MHALSPACHMAPTCMHPHHMCRGALFSPPSVCRVHATLPLCANGECRVAPKRYTPPTFCHHPHSVRQNNECRTHHSSPFPPPFHAQVGASSPQQGTESCCMPQPSLMHASGAHEWGWGWGDAPFLPVPPFALGGCGGWTAARAGAVPPPLPLWPPAHANKGNRWGHEDGNRHTGGVAPPPFACRGKWGPRRNAPTPLLPCPHCYILIRLHILHRYI